MLRIVLFILMIQFSFINLNAKNVGDMLASVPTETMPYVTHEQLVELINLKRIDPQTPACLSSVLKTQICLDSLADDLLVFKAGEVVYEIARLDAEGDSVYCLLRTILTPEKETTGYIVNENWEVIGDIDFTSFDFFSRHDTISVKDFNDLKSLIDFPIVEAHFDKSPLSINMHLNCQALNEEEKEKVKAVLLQRKVKWDGISYK